MAKSVVYDRLGVQSVSPCSTPGSGWTERARLRTTADDASTAAERGAQRVPEFVASGLSKSALQNHILE